MTPRQAEAIREAAQKTYAELFAPADAAQLAAVGEVIAPAWRQVCRENHGRQTPEKAAMPPGEAA